MVWIIHNPGLEGGLGNSNNTVKKKMANKCKKIVGNLKMLSYVDSTLFLKSAISH